MPDRRDFLKTAAVLAVTAAHAPGANERVTVAVIGTGGMGSNHLRMLAARKDVAVAYVCDTDADRLAEAGRAAAGAKPVKDLRTVLDDKTVDAVWVTTPDHWHGPATILALDAGKHVYVEKPCAHNIREGRLMIEAARRNKRVVQVGTQSRSSEHIVSAMQALKEGVIGEVIAAKAWNSQRRGAIGRATPSSPPATLDYDLWVGPAVMVPYQSNRTHYSWHWWYDFGTGDMGNDGVHELDIARWGLGVQTHPVRVAALGGKYAYEDDQQFPDTQYVVFEYVIDGHRKQLVYEQRLWSPYFQEGYENGNAYYGTKGMLILGKGGGWKVVLEKNQPGPSKSGSVNLPAHHDDFLACIRGGGTPHADIAIGHHSAALCHLGNLATRLGRTLHFDPKTESITGDSEAAKLVRRTYREGHWAVPKGV